MQMKLELIPLAVSDVDRAICFYAGKLGFTKDVDVQPADGVRIVQLTPEGSGCSVGFGTGLDVYGGEPGSSRGIHLVVEDIVAARDELVRRTAPAHDRLESRRGDEHLHGLGARGRLELRMTAARALNSSEPAGPSGLPQRAQRASGSVTESRHSSRVSAAQAVDVSVRGSRPPDGLLQKARDPLRHSVEWFVTDCYRNRDDAPTPFLNGTPARAARPTVE